MSDVRNFDRIEEEDPDRLPPAVRYTFFMLAGACVVFAVVALCGRRVLPHAHDGLKVDPLDELVSQRVQGGGAKASGIPEITSRDVTFPTLLSDSAKPTTALAAVRGEAAAAKEAKNSKGAPTAPPPPSVEARRAPPPVDTLPVVPLPAQNALEATALVTRPKDALTKAASESAGLGTQSKSGATPLAPPGHEGGYQLQVSSFRDEREANQFADQLRARGHKAYVTEAHVGDRGTWYRVRIGPFAAQELAAAYRKSFEAKEHVVPIVVSP